MKPQRIQRKRTKGWRMPPNTVYVGRPTKWGNDHYIGGEIREYIAESGQWERRKATAADAVNFFEADMHGRKGEIQRELRGKNLACWCPLDQPCHADVLLRMANED